NGGGDASATARFPRPGRGAVDATADRENRGAPPARSRLMSAAPLGLDHSAAPSRPSRSRWLGDSGSLRALWPMAAALVALAGGRLALDASRLGPVAGHMGAHILLMNAVAPLLALAVLGRFPALAGHFASGHMLLAASLA